MKKFVIILTFLTSLLIGAETFRVDPIALEQARHFSKALTKEKVVEILFHDSLRPCMQNLAIMAKRFDRSDRNEETALWIVQKSEGRYSCEFWPKISSRRGKVDWDGHLPYNTLFSLHTHPRRSGGERPSEEDHEFNDSLGIIGLIFSSARRRISLTFPDSERYHVIVRGRKFRELTRD